MNNQEAIETLKANYPDTCYEQLREAVDMAISALQAQGKCEDAVSRTDMLETYADLYDIFEDNDQIRKELNKVYDKLNALSSVTPKRKTGRWLDNYQDGYKCSECGAYLEIDCGDLEMNFCPNCSADMRG